MQSHNIFFVSPISHILIGLKCIDYVFLIKIKNILSSGWNSFKVTLLKALKLITILNF